MKYLIGDIGNSSTKICILSGKFKILKWDTTRKSLVISKQIGLSPEIEEVELFAP